jgi:hypothetical protein
MSQLDLFDHSVREPLAAPVQATARISDPQSSHDAAERMNRGKAKRHRERVVDLVWSHPGNTSKGLVAFTDAQDKEDGIDRHEIARRLSEAEAAGDVYRVEQAGSDLRWFPGRAK